MAAGTLPKPGTKLGPCARRCRHLDCAATRAAASADCVRCAKPIGYDTPYYVVSAVMGDRYAHARCEEKAAEQAVRS